HLLEGLRDFVHYTRLFAEKRFSKNVTVCVPDVLRTLPECRPLSEQSTPRVATAQLFEYLRQLTQFDRVAKLPHRRIEYDSTFRSHFELRFSTPGHGNKNQNANENRSRGGRETHFAGSGRDNKGACRFDHLQNFF